MAYVVPMRRGDLATNRLAPGPRPAPNSGSSSGSSGSNNFGNSDSAGPEGEGGEVLEGGVKAPFFLEGFPEFMPVDFPSIEAANYKFIDPQEFAKSFGEFNAGQISKNFGTAKNFALEALDNELAGLKQFVPAAAALKREQTSVDNQFNQQLRTKQVNSVLPNARGDLAAQRGRAQSYTEGRLPGELDDALNLAIRGRAADRASAGGFGARSGEAAKISDLMSAEERFQIAQYGENLTNQNLATTASLFLSPTSYSNAGEQVRVTPEVGAGRLTYEGAGMLNEATLLSPAQAYTSKINQEQFSTQLKQRTNEFNATGEFNASQFNSTGGFTAALGAFQYDVSYLNAVQTADQAQLNMASQINGMGLQADTFGQGQAGAQGAATVQSGLTAIGAIPTAVNGITQALGLNSPPQAGGNTGGSNINTAPSSSDVTSATTQTPNVDLGSPQIQYQPTARGVDASSPSSAKFASGTAAPSGYVPVASNGDGTYSAANIKDYGVDLERFARSSGIPAGSVSVENAAMADRTLSNSAALSYLPVPGFQPMATSASGKPVYSLPAAAASGNIGAGAANVSNIGTVLATLGITDPKMLDAVSHIAGVSSDPAFINDLNQLYSDRGGSAVSSAILNKMFDKAPSTDTAAGQQANFMANRMGEMWGGFSPYQKSMAMAGLAGAGIEIKSGKNASQQVVPGTEGSVGGGLKVGDVVNATSQGLNGYSMARNWDQLSAFGAMSLKTKSPNQVAQVATQAGLIGFGPQGASVPLDPAYLPKVGAQPAPELGVGAAVFNTPSLVPSNYKIISQTPSGKPIAMPGNLVHTSPIGTGGPTQLAYSKSRQVAQGKHPAQKLWGSKGPLPNGLIRGSAGGSAIISGLGLMIRANPNLAGSMTAYSLFNNTMGD